ncbi:hypothetical protein AK830_g1360 [Neonectria ditissima]|uniref:Carboxylesterase type B domain-containing protein n=1 Tax=Neonectria ditissima TaxID=78410 RepID=A0A0P7B693_9HYPO|nr:hypothetical protein AK830_g1360 [Neonectria ditissima]
MAYPPTGVSYVDVPSLGRVKGNLFGHGVRQFCGIPYANLSKRWTRSALNTSLAGGYHDGTQHGAICPQPPEYMVGEDYMVPVPRFPHFKDPVEAELACLNLNLVLPPESLINKPVPVMVWIHGGSFLFGSSTHPAFDMVALVSRAADRGTPIVGVSLNYRVGLFGFLASRDIQEDLAQDGYSGAGNFGLTDQQTALEWVQRYIGAFGGDASQVTVFGESAGGMSVAHQIWARQPAVFHRAISMSGTLNTIPSWSLSQHERRYRALLGRFGIPSSDANALDRLRRLPEEAIAASTCLIEGTMDATGNPCDDGWYHARPPSPTSISSPPAWLRGYMIGDVKDEGMIFHQAIRDEDFESMKASLRVFLGPAGTEDIVSKYNIDSSSTPGEVQSQYEKMASDGLFTVQNRLHAQASSIPQTFVYHMDQVSTLENPLEGLAYHGIDILYVFGNLTEKMTEGQKGLVAKISGDWLDFAWGKDPWERYHAGNRAMVYGPLDRASLKSEKEDEATRHYQRIEQILAKGVLEPWVLALDRVGNKRWLLENATESGGVDRQVACEGYQVTLPWDWGVASRDNLARSTMPVVPRNSGVVAESSPLSSLGHDVTVDYDTIDHDVAVSHIIVDHDNDTNNCSPASDATAHSWDYQSDESHRLFSQFLCSGLHTLYSTTTHSWIKEMMVELSLESPAFFAACMTLELLQDKTCAEKFHLCFERALQIFQAELSEEAGAMWRATLGAGILLCTISIDQGIVWTSNLQCMADLYRLSQDGWPKTWFTDPFLLHLLEVMGVMDLPNLVLGRLTPCLGIWKRLRRAQATWGGENMGGIEIVTGLPRSLLDILAFSDEPTVEQDLWLWEGVEGSLLQSFHWMHGASVAFCLRDGVARPLHPNTTNPHYHSPSPPHNTFYGGWLHRWTPCA